MSRPVRWFLAGVLAGAVLASSTWAILVLLGWSTRAILEQLAGELVSAMTPGTRAATIPAGSGRA